MQADHRRLPGAPEGIAATRPSRAASASTDSTRHPSVSAGPVVRPVKDGFCPTCEVTLDLHDTKDGEDESDCELAFWKADRIMQFQRMFR